LILGGVPCQPGTVLRVWRWVGTVSTSNIPTRVADIPIAGPTSYLYDTGDQISGVPWTTINGGGIPFLSRGQIGNNAPTGDSLDRGGTFLGITSPTGGFWNQGDRVKHWAAAAGAPAGWVCSATGKAHKASAATTLANPTAVLTAVTNIDTWVPNDVIVVTNGVVTLTTTINNINLGLAQIGLSANYTGAAGAVTMTGDAVFRPEANL
jgi:hypothetical protein